MEQTIYLVLAVAGCTLLLLQVLLQVFGLAEGTDFDTDGHADLGHMDAGHAGPGDHAHASDPGHGNWFFGLLSLKALCAFAGIFGLTGLALLDTDLSPGLRIMFAVEAGIVAMVVVAFLMRGLSRLSASGTLDPRNAIGRRGAVYLRVPAAGTGAGKVTVEVQGRSIELEAVTDGPEIPTGTRVEVVDMVGSDTLKVVRADG
jgi:membrane protein implicated in regulation of membrane protease activity